MDLNQLADQIASLSERIATRVEGQELDENAKYLAAFISTRLLEIERECRSGVLKPRYKRDPELTYYVTDTDRPWLGSELTKELIQLEWLYQNMGSSTP